jgi:hypothetical protein
MKIMAFCNESYYFDNENHGFLLNHITSIMKITAFVLNHITSIMKIMAFVLNLIIR